MKVYDRVTDVIGHTPLVRLARIDADLPFRLFGKLEAKNPGGSVKDRIARAMVDAAEASGELKPGGTLVEPTSGNTGIALAMICAARGYKLVLTMPESMSPERIALLRAYGAELVLTPGTLMIEAVKRAEKLVKQTDGAIMLQQFENAANPQAHRETTAVEIWEDMDGEVDAVIAGVGTGGTITGCASYLKEKKPSVKAFAVEPKTAAVLSGQKAGPHFIQGIGAGFIPKVLQRDLLDGVVAVSEEEAFSYSRRLSLEEGVLVGISSGANVAAAVQLGKKHPELKGKNVVTFLCDSGERYISTPIFQEIFGDHRR